MNDQHRVINTYCTPSAVWLGYSGILPEYDTLKMLESGKCKHYYADYYSKNGHHILDPKPKDNICDVCFDDLYNDKAVFDFSFLPFADVAEKEAESESDSE